VHVFTLEREERLAINMPNQRFREPPVRRYVEELLAGREGPGGQGLQHALGRFHGRRCLLHPGGAATTGRGRILEVVPTSLHQRVPVILGSRHEVERVTGYHA
jgi:fructose-1,6-bisphosphatase I